VVDERIVIKLSRARLQEMKNDLTIFRVVLIPGVIVGLASAGDRDGGDEAKAEALAVEKVSQRAVIIAGGFKANEARRAARVEESGEALEVREG
jgi:hypothetical protein